MDEAKRKEYLELCPAFGKSADGKGGCKPETEACTWCADDRQVQFEECRKETMMTPEATQQPTHIKWEGEGYYQEVKAADDKIVLELDPKGMQIGHRHLTECPDDLEKIAVTKSRPGSRRVTKTSEYVRIIRSTGAPMAVEQAVAEMKKTFPDASDDNLEQTILANNSFLVQCGAMVKNEDKTYTILPELVLTATEE